MLETLPLRIVLERQRINGVGGANGSECDGYSNEYCEKTPHSFSLSLREGVPRSGG